MASLVYPSRDGSLPVEAHHAKTLPEPNGAPPLRIVFSDGAEYEQIRVTLHVGGGSDDRGKPFCFGWRRVR